MPGEDHRMERFTRPGGRTRTATDALLTVAVAAIILLLVYGASIKHQAAQMTPGVQRSLVKLVGDPAANVANKLPLGKLAHRATASLSPDPSLGAGGGFQAPSATGAADAAVTPDAFDPRRFGERMAPRPLQTLLVTGDSMSTPLDVDLARMLEPKGVHVIRDVHLGTGISKSDLVDWGKLSAHQVAQDKPDATVVFLGANDGFPMPGADGKPVSCCGRPWAAIYATRVRQMMSTYRRGGAGAVYWLTLPTPREHARVQIADAVNAAVQVAAQPWRDAVSVLDTVPVFTPGDRYRDAMPVGGRQQIVRQPDGIHLNDTGSQLEAQLVERALAQRFALGG